MTDVEDLLAADDPGREAGPAGLRLVHPTGRTAPEFSLDRSGPAHARRHRPGHPHRGVDRVAPAGSGRVPQRDPTVAAGGDPAGHPGHHPRGGRGRVLRPRRGAVPPGHRPGGHVGPRPGARRWPTTSAPRCWPSAPARACRRCWTSPATPAGAGWRRPTARTRCWPASWASPTCGACRAPGRSAPTAAPLPAWPTAWWPPASTSSGYGLPDGGLNHGPVQLGSRELREVFAEPFAAAIRDAGMASVMNSLLVGRRPALRRVAAHPHRAAPGRAGLHRHGGGRLLRGRPAADAPPRGADQGRRRGQGTDGRHGRGAPGPRLLRRSWHPWWRRRWCPVEVVDAAVRRVLRQKVAPRPVRAPLRGRRGGRGRVRHPGRTGRWPGVPRWSRWCCWTTTAPCRSAPAAPGPDRRHRPGGRRPPPARGRLPLPRPPRDHLRHRRAGTPAAELLPQAGGAFAPGPYLPDIVTPLGGLRAALLGADVEVVHERGCDVTGDGPFRHRPPRSQAATGADVVVLCVGGRSGLTLDATVGEARDAVDLDLTGVQLELLRRGGRHRHPGGDGGGVRPGPHPGRGGGTLPPPRCWPGCPGSRAAPHWPTCCWARWRRRAGCRSACPARSGQVPGALQPPGRWRAQPVLGRLHRLAVRAAAPVRVRAVHHHLRLLTGAWSRRAPPPSRRPVSP